MRETAVIFGTRQPPLVGPPTEPHLRSGVGGGGVTAAPTGSYVPPALPESGQVVEVRRSNGAVANVHAQGLSRSPAIEVTTQVVAWEQQREQGHQ